MERFNESKESTINKCINLTQDQRDDALAFFNGKGQNLWGSIDWNKPQNVTWGMIEELMSKARQSNQQMRKRMKSGDIGFNDITEGKDYRVLADEEDFSLYEALSHRGACVLASNDVSPKVHNYVPNWARRDENEWYEVMDEHGKAGGAHWCISMFRTDSHWKEYVGDFRRRFYIFMYHGDGKTLDKWRKMCVEIADGTGEDERTGLYVWDGDDNEWGLMDVENEIGVVSKPFKKAVEMLLDYKDVPPEEVKAWEGLVDRFGGFDHTGISPRTLSYESNDWYASLRFHATNAIGDIRGYNGFEEFLRSSTSWSSKNYVSLVVGVDAVTQSTKDEIDYIIDDFGVSDSCEVVYNVYTAYKPHSIAISMDMRGKDDKMKVVDFLNAILDKGDEIFTQYEHDVTAKDIWDKVKNLPWFDEWEEMVDSPDMGLTLDKYDDNGWYMYVGMKSDRKKYTTKEEILSKVNPYNDMVVYLQFGTVNRDSRHLSALADGAREVGIPYMVGTITKSYQYNGNTYNDILQPLLKDCNRLMEVFGFGE